MQSVFMANQEADAQESLHPWLHSTGVITRDHRGDSIGFENGAGQLRFMPARKRPQHYHGILSVLTLGSHLRAWLPTRN